MCGQVLLHRIRTFGCGLWVCRRYNDMREVLKEKDKFDCGGKVGVVALAVHGEEGPGRV